jgi:hypothetical protein
MKRPIWGLSLLCTSLLLIASCSPADIPAPDDANAPESGQPAAEGGAPQAGSNQIMIAGARDITYAPIAQVVSNIGGQYEIFFQLQTDDPNLPSGVRIFIPEGTAVGSYDMVSLLDLEDGVSARFDYSNAGVIDYFEGTDGHLELIEAGDTYSGSFTFNAVDPRDQSRFISVSGNFDGATPAQ